MLAVRVGDSDLTMAELGSPIATETRECVALFEQLSALVYTRQNIEASYGISSDVLSEHYGQFKVWAGNIGALQRISSKSSMDYRLRDAPKFTAQTVLMLQDLRDTLQDICAITAGERENRASSPITETYPPSNEDDPHERSTVNSGVELDEDGTEIAPISEIQDLFESIPETIASLFKISVLVRNSSSRDRFAKALAAAVKNPFDDHFDIEHVGHKFPRLRHEDMAWLRTRLGKAITQRRQYLRYCREHREKMSRIHDDPEPSSLADQSKPLATVSPKPVGLALPQRDDDQTSVITSPSTGTTLASTLASTVVPAQLETVNLRGGMTEDVEEDTRSQSSYASSVAEDDSNHKLSVVRFEEISTPGKSFECPYCWTVQNLRNHNAWRKHVMADLKPFVCTAETCEMKMFPDSQTWLTHELQNHLVEWKCCFCNHIPFSSFKSFQTHLYSKHTGQFSEAQFSTLTEVCQKPLDKLLPSACKLCDSWEAKLREVNSHIPDTETLVVTPQQFRHHIRNHMEQLALFAIPRGYKEEGDAGSNKVALGQGSESSSNQSLLVADYENESNPRLHIAAFEGLTEEVEKGFTFSMNRITSVRYRMLEVGTTWGSVLAAAAAGGHAEVFSHILNLYTELLSQDKPMTLPRSTKNGWGPLHWAASNGHISIVELLLQNGFDPDLLDVEGRSPAEIATNHGFDEVASLISNSPRSLVTRGQPDTITQPQLPTIPQQTDRGNNGEPSRTRTPDDIAERFPQKIQALYSYRGNPEDPKELSFLKNEVMRVEPESMKDRWWSARKANGEIGIVPSNYVRTFEGQVPQQLPQPTTLETSDRIVPPTSYDYRAKAIYSYSGNPEDLNELSFAKHEIVEVGDITGRWWQARKEDGQTGIIPSNYFILL